RNPSWDAGNSRRVVPAPCAEERATLAKGSLMGTGKYNFHRTADAFTSGARTSGARTGPSAVEVMAKLEDLVNDLKLDGQKEEYSPCALIDELMEVAGFRRQPPESKCQTPYAPSHYNMVSKRLTAMGWQSVDLLCPLLGGKVKAAWWFNIDNHP